VSLFWKILKTEKKKQRLDLELVQRSLAPSREKARALIMAGEVLVDRQVKLKASDMVGQDQEILLRKRYPYVSRGAFKLQKALEEFNIDPRDFKVLDIGVSTGGFADLLLQKGAREVQGIDVNIQQVDVSLRNNDRVTLLKKNARYLAATDLVFEPDLVVIDVSFISVLKILNALTFLKKGVVLALIKPQFEGSPREVKKGGVIRDARVLEDILFRTRGRIEGMGWKVNGTVRAGIRGRKGNQEFFFLLVPAPASGSAGRFNLSASGAPGKDG